MKRECPGLSSSHGQGEVRLGTLVLPRGIHLQHKVRMAENVRFILYPPVCV